jgi:hypothetical protein
MTPYTIKIAREESKKLEDIDIYEYLDARNDKSIFENTNHPYFRYYSRKTPHINLVEYTGEENSEAKIAEENTLYLCLSEGVIDTKLKNMFLTKGGRVLYLEKDDATLDLERTWKMIEQKRDLTSIKKIVFTWRHWSKLVYAYRAAKVYTLEIEDASK